MKRFFVLAVLLVATISLAQERYEYVIVPTKFDFFKNENEYNLNALTKSFFETEGFAVYYDKEELPKELAKDRCKAFYVDAVESNNMFKTRITIQIKDCQNKILLESFEGTSSDKSYKVAYNEAFRFALTSLKGQLNFKNNLADNSKSNKEIADEAVEMVEDVVAEVIPATPQKSTNPNQLFALPTENGYKLVDSVPNVIYLIQTSSEANVFIASKGEIHGVFQKKINGWYFDYYQDGKLISEKVSVKF